MSASAPHPSSAVRPRVAGTENPKITIIGPTSASAPMDATCSSEKATMPEVARRGSTPAPCQHAYLGGGAGGAAERRGGGHRVADELRRPDQREVGRRRLPVVDQQSLQHPREEQHRTLADEQRDQPVPVDLDQAVRRREHPEHRGGEEVDDRAAHDPRQAAPDHPPYRGRVGGADRGGIDDERAGRPRVGDVGHGGFHQASRFTTQSIGPRELCTDEGRGWRPESRGRGRNGPSRHAIPSAPPRRSLTDGVGQVGWVG